MAWAAGLIVLVNLGLGWLLGRCRLFRGPAVPALARPEAYHIREVARDLVEHVADVHREVKTHHGRVEQVSQGLLAVQSGQRDDAEESVLSAVSEILKINLELQNRLMAAEGRLHDQSKQIESLMAHAWTDPLTGVPNRRAFENALERQVAASQRTGSPLSVVLVDADHFKAINDQLGHAAGDFALRRLAEMLEGGFRKMDLVARIGGEEFAVILPSTAGPHAARAAEHVRLAVAAQEIQNAEFQIRLTVSLGIAAADSGDDAGALLRRADQALYAAKEGGRNCTFLHDGQQCRLVGRRPNSPPAGSPPSVAQGGSMEDSAVYDVSEINAACHSLRQSVAEIAAHDG